MPDDYAFYDGYDAVEIELPPDGRTVRCRPLLVGNPEPSWWQRLSGWVRHRPPPNRNALYYIRLMAKAEQGDLKLLEQALTDFLRAVGHPELRYLMPGELVEVMRRFFSARRPIKKPATSGLERSA